MNSKVVENAFDSDSSDSSEASFHTAEIVDEDSHATPNHTDGKEGAKTIQNIPDGEASDSTASYHTIDATFHTSVEIDLDNIIALPLSDSQVQSELLVPTAIEEESHSSSDEYLERAPTSPVMAQ